jgi:hypothetical protein
MFMRRHRDGQMLVDERHRRSTFSDRDALYRSRSHVTDRIHPRHARFEGNGHPPFCVLRGRSRDDESVGIERDATAVEPFGLRIRADEYKQVPHLVCRLDAGACFGGCAIAQRGTRACAHRQMPQAPQSSAAG